MKKKSNHYPPQDASALYKAIAKLHDPSDIALVLKDLLTPAELEAVIDRWQICRSLIEGHSYRTIAQKTGVSVTTIGRVARDLYEGHGGYKKALEMAGIKLKSI